MLTNSWIIVDRRTRKAVCETYESRTAEAARAHHERYSVYTAHAYLVALNAAIKAGITDGSLLP